MVDAIAGYRLETLVGRGSTGTVWSARRSGPIDHPVAVKRVPSSDPTAVQRLRQEAEILAALDHPHTVDLIEVIDDPPGLALVMPLARGGSLRHLLDECGTLAAGQVVAVLAPIAEALASAHRRHIAHGDVKPSNVLFTGDGEPLLADFGVARHLGGTVLPHLSVRGTATYMDPALLDGGEPGDRADVYALAVVAYEALAGRPPHRGSAAEVLAAAEAGDHPPLGTRPGLPAALAGLVESALARDPRARPTAAELAAGLRASVDTSSVVLPGPAVRHHVEVDEDGTRLFGPRPPAPAVTPSAPGRRAVLAVAAIVAALAVAGAWWVQRDASSAAGGRDAVPTADARPDHHAAARCTAVDAHSSGDGDPDRTVADLDGDGCPDRASWDGRLLVARLSSARGRPRAFRVGEPGDQVLIGDWDCDGVASPALYRPDTGEVRYASGLARRVGDRVYASRVAHRVRHGRAMRIAGPGGCDEVRVRPADRNDGDGR